MIQSKLYELQDLKYRAFSLKLLPPDTPLIGVRLPILRKLSKNLTLSELTDDTFEEIMLQGMVIGRMKDLKEVQKACLIFLPKIQNWSICDSFVASLKITKQYSHEMLSFLKPLVSSSHPFTRRFVLVMLLYYYLDNAYYEDIRTVIRTIDQSSYYVEMALAWLLAELYVQDSSEALAILKDSSYNLSRFTIRKSISKIRDSYQVGQEEKDSLKQFLKELEGGS